MKYQRNEYPRPQFRRDSWQSLNGEWEFDFVKEKPRDLQMPLNMKINVPFSYQWEASGINDQSVHEHMVYRRCFLVSERNIGKRVLLCFNAVDYECTVWVNDHSVITHEGGFTPFYVDISAYLNGGENTIVVYCKDPQETAIPRGKQSWTGEQFSCFYHGNSGIWQSVWLEFFASDCISHYDLQSDVDNQLIYGFIESLYGKADEIEITATVNGKVIRKQNISMSGRQTRFTVNLQTEAFDFRAIRWSPECPNLVYVDFKLMEDGIVCDEAHTRIGLRKISIENGQIKLNNAPLYQRLVLDQGYWPESGLTPPSADAIKKDIELAKAMGFNGARKHQKIEDPYYNYYAEELGFLTWCEMPSAYTFCDKEVAAIVNQWQDIVCEARKCTSVIAYVPLNESWGTRDIKVNKNQQDFARSLYYITRCLDSTRFISTNDGFENLNESDVVSVHDYVVKNATEFPDKYNHGYDGMYPQGKALFADGHRYQGQPILFTEFGGIAYVGDQRSNGWGYGAGAKDEEELLRRLEELVDGILTTKFQGYCYTQLTDVQQEVNGLLHTDRTPKADLSKIRTIFGRKQ